MAKTKIIYPKNVAASVAMNFTYNELSASMAIEKIKILGAVLELSAKQHCQSSPFISKLGQIGQIGSAVIISVLASAVWRVCQTLELF